jgi:hypothetical protein
MFPVLYKNRISKNESYPVGAQELSSLLGSVPQAISLQIAFWRRSTPRV